MPSSPLNRLLRTKMDRKEFLARTGAMVMVLVGASGIIKAITMTDARRTSGYGRSRYGGSKSSSASNPEKVS